MSIENYDLDGSDKLNQFCVERGLSDSSKRKYKICLKRYVKFHNLTLEDLINEADNEEEDILRINKRNIRKRLIDFRVYLKENYATNTVLTTMSSVNTFYKHFGITIPELPLMKYNKSPNDKIEFEDLPTIEHIKEAIENVNTPKHKALFLFMACSGTARNETANFTFGQFLDGMKEFCPDVETPEDIIREFDGKCEVEGQKTIMPIFKMERIKTEYEYYTIITPECTQFMINYLKSNGLGLKEEDKFFQLNVNGITSAYRSINNKLKWGKKGTIDFFSPHRLRKFNASVIEDNDLANYIQGRKPSRIRETYFKMNKIRVREEYEKHFHKFGIYSQYDVVINSEAYKRLLSEKNKLSSELEQAKKDYAILQNDVRDMRNEIDNVSLINDIAKIQDFIVDNELVNKYNLASDVITLYKEDIKKDDFIGVTNDYIDELIMVAYNRKMGEKNTSFGKPIYNDEEWKEINDCISLIVSNHESNCRYKYSNSQKNKLKERLEEYAKNIWLNEESVDEHVVRDIVDEIAVR